jgi:glyoxylase-like metal-dependent hydrolase (beta-lactamase superfamily II)
VKITSHVSQVGGAEDSDPADAAIYLIADGGEAALVDAGTGRGTHRVLANLRRAGVEPGRVKQLFLTHCHYDHTGGAELLRQQTGCRIVAHALDAAFLEAGDSRVTAASWYGAGMTPLAVDVKVTGAAQTFTVGGLEVVFRHAPGHSPGSSVLTVRSDDRLVLFGQDVHGPLDPTLRSVRADYQRSLRLLLELDADILCEGHFGVLVGKDEVRDFIESYL